VNCSGRRFVCTSTRSWFGANRPSRAKARRLPSITHAGVDRAGEQRLDRFAFTADVIAVLAEQDIVANGLHAGAGLGEREQRDQGRLG